MICNEQAWFNISGGNEYESVKKNYSKVIDAYGCLGIMRINAGKSK